MNGSQTTFATPTVSGTTFAHRDLVGSLAMATDETGSPSNTFVPTAFGESVAGGPSIDTRYEYAGGYGIFSCMDVTTGWT